MQYTERALVSWIKKVGAIGVIEDLKQMVKNQKNMDSYTTKRLQEADILKEDGTVNADYIKAVCA